MPVDITFRDGAPPQAPPVPPQAPPAEPLIDEGPMRRELLRQIAVLDSDLGARMPTPVRPRATAARGPALQSTQALERIRDELLEALKTMRRV